MRLNPDLSKLEAFRRKWRVTGLWYHGSVLRSWFRQDSDVDVVLEFAGGDEPGLLELAAMREELSAALRWPADITTLGALRRDPNRRRSGAILREMRKLVPGR
jgi:predicted nucleotidyltransferase